MSYDDGRRSSGGITVDIKFKKKILLKNLIVFLIEEKKSLKKYMRIQTVERNE